MSNKESLETTLKAIEEYCRDINNGTYDLQPGENPLLRIQALAQLAVSGVNVSFSTEI